MPKEVVVRDKAGRQRFEISWGRSGVVQMATCVWGPDGLEAEDYVDLSRDHINNMIRTLRRARDHAYGRDE